MALSDFLISTFSGMLESAGETKLVEILQGLHDKDLDSYMVAIHGGHALTSKLLPVVQKTQSKIDDIILSAIQDAVNKSAEDNDVKFDEHPAPTPEPPAPTPTPAP